MNKGKVSPCTRTPCSPRGGGRSPRCPWGLLVTYKVLRRLLGLVRLGAQDFVLGSPFPPLPNEVLNTLCQVTQDTVAVGRTGPCGGWKLKGVLLHPSAIRAAPWGVRWGAPGRARQGRQVQSHLDEDGTGPSSECRSGGPERKREDRTGDLEAVGATGDGRTALKAGPCGLRQSPRRPGDGGRGCDGGVWNCSGGGAPQSSRDPPARRAECSSAA